MDDLNAKKLGGRIPRPHNHRPWWQDKGTYKYPTDDWAGVAGKGGESFQIVFNTGGT